MDAATERVYDEMAATFAANRWAIWREHTERFLKRADASKPVVDAGCGTGVYLPVLEAHPAGVVGADRAEGMLRVAQAAGPRWPLVRADHAAAPIATGMAGGAFARHSFVHTPHAELPMLLRELRRTLTSEAPLSLSLIAAPGDEPSGFVGGGDLPGRTFHTWTADALEDVAVGAGFVPADGRRKKIATKVAYEIDGDHFDCVWVEGRRARSIADTVGDRMSILVCGLNPSLHAADADIGFVTPGNRFWPAAIEAGLASRDRDPKHALVHHGVGMTDVVKRATPRASSLETGEYVAGLGRVERLCAWLEPAVICFVGLAGWRAVRDRQATAGLQDQALGDTPVYVVPSTSGLNASSQHTDFVEHFRTVRRIAERTKT